MKLLKWLDDNLEEILMMIFLALIVVIMGIQVIMRYIFRNSLMWPEELSRYFFIWFVFLGISYGVKKNAHIRVDIVEVLIPRTAKVLGVIQDIAFAVFCICLYQPGMKVMEMMMQTGQTSPAIGIPMYIVYFSLMVGLTLTPLRILQKYLLKLRKKGGSKE